MSDVTPLRIGVLSRQPSLYSTRRLVEAAAERGHSVRVVDYLRCYMDITSKRPTVIFQGETLEFDAVVPRIGATYTFYGTAVVRQFEISGVYSVASPDAISRARDKLRSLQMLAHEGVGMPVTGFAHSTKDIDGLIDIVDGAPLVIKLLEGTQGVGVVLAETKAAAESVIAAFRQLDANILVQKFIHEADGADVRAFVVGRRVVASMERRARQGEFRANLHRGGSASSIKLTKEERAAALKAARIMGLEVAGVDLLRSSEGPMVIEVNASPGLEGIETASGVDVAGAVIAHIEKQVGT